VIDRKWQTGDRVLIELDISLRYWRGEREYEGKSSIYRGPLLLSYELDQPEPRFSPHWKAFGESHATRDKGATVEQEFEGDEITWRGSLFDDAGQASVTIDGKQAAVVDQYGPKRGEPFAWTKNDLGPGPHTIRIEVLGEKIADSKDVWINVSEIVTSRLSPALDRATLVGPTVKVSCEADFYIELPDTAGKIVRLRDFGRAGRDRRRYVTWLDVRGSTVTPFSRQNPSRTAH
jgi:hypothetical protein